MAQHRSHQLSQSRRTQHQRPIPQKVSQAEQQERFRQTARDLGCDEDEKAFDEKLKKIATQKPKPPTKKGD